MIKYMDEIKYISALPLPWEKLDQKTVLISGATGLIGSFLIHVLMNRREEIRIIALGRKEEMAKKRFQEYWGMKKFHFISHDINMPLPEAGEIGYMIHAASNTHPIAYASDPIGTILTNIIGTFNLLNYAASHKTERFLFASSVEIYGENRDGTEVFTEDACGYIDCNTLRAGYPESKRAGEALCQAFKAQKGINIVIGRLSRTYGPTMLQSDTKAISQFIKCGVQKKDIILKSEGKQFYSYSYVADAVSALLTILLKGKNGEAYNISDDASNISLKDLSRLIASYAGSRVVFQEAEAKEAAGYSKATQAVLDSGKLQNLGWKAHWDIQSGLRRTMALLDLEE